MDQKAFFCKKKSGFDMFKSWYTMLIHHNFVWSMLAGKLHTLSQAFFNRSLERDQDLRCSLDYACVALHVVKPSKTFILEKFTIGTPSVHHRYTIGTPSVHHRYTIGTLSVHHRYTIGTPSEIAASCETDMPIYWHIL